MRQAPPPPEPGACPWDICDTRGRGIFVRKRRGVGSCRCRELSAKCKIGIEMGLGGGGGAAAMMFAPSPFTLLGSHLHLRLGVGRPSKMRCSVAAFAFGSAVLPCARGFLCSSVVARRGGSCSVEDARSHLCRRDLRKRSLASPGLAMMAEGRLTVSVLNFGRCPARAMQGHCSKAFVRGVVFSSWLHASFGEPRSPKPSYSREGAHDRSCTVRGSMPPTYKVFCLLSPIPHPSPDARLPG